MTVNTGEKALHGQRGMERDLEMREDTVSQREGEKRHSLEPHSQSVEPKEKRDYYLSRGEERPRIDATFRERNG